ncbi:MAG: dTMP kinase [Microgenomates group bacterium]|nr:dTMP kinase [Microgenomates group bacterium]
MFIVIEGIDGAGCETQAKKLIEKLSNRKAFFVKYPDYDKNVGRFIREFLYQNKDLTAEQQFLFYSLQFIFDAKTIAAKRKNGIVVADRYFTTTLCFQTLEGINLKTALNFACDFKIEKPDLVFYLDVRPEIAIKRKSGEAKDKNRREKDFQFIKKTYQQYKILVKNQIWTRWIAIDGERTVDEISDDIYNKVKLKIADDE